MKALITGAAGFIGRTLVDRCLELDWDVTGIDALTDYYPRAQKLTNISDARQNSRFRFIEGDLLELDLASLLSDVDVVFHQAGQPGVRASWAEGFADYVDWNARHATLTRGCDEGDAATLRLCIVVIDLRGGADVSHDRTDASGSPQSVRHQQTRR